MEEFRCLNCDSASVERFCANCGQRAFDPNAITIGTFARDSLHDVTDIDSKFGATMHALVLKPGMLTRDYFEGKRERYLTPVKLYLLVSAVFFLFAWGAYMSEESLLAQLKSHPQFKRIAEAPPAERARILPALLKSATDWSAWFRFAGVLVLAATLKLVLFRRHQLYTQHLVFSFHYYAYDFLFYTLLAIPLLVYERATGTHVTPMIVSVTFLVLVAYLYFAAKRAYALSSGKALALAIVLFIADAIISLLAGTLGMGIAQGTMQS